MKRHYLYLSDDEFVDVIRNGPPIMAEFGPGFVRICREDSPDAFDYIQQRWASQLV